MKHSLGLVLVVVEVAHHEDFLAFVDEVLDVAVVPVTLTFEFGIPLQKYNEDAVHDQFGHAVSVDEEAMSRSLGEDTAATGGAAGDVFMTVLLEGHTGTGARFVRETV